MAARRHALHTGIIWTATQLWDQQKWDRAVNVVALKHLKSTDVWPEVDPDEQHDDEKRDYNNAVRQHMKEQAEKNLDDFLSAYWTAQHAGYATLYRTVVVSGAYPELGVQLSAPGRYWAFQLNMAYPHGASTSKGHVLTLQADVHWKDIDWESSFFLAIEYFHDENEARLFAASPLRVDGYWTPRLWTRGDFYDLRGSSEARAKEKLRYHLLRFPVYTTADEETPAPVPEPA